MKTAPVSLIQIVDTAVADAYRRGGPHLVCKPGCSQCCIGVFPIAHQDAARLREGLGALKQTDPEKYRRIRTRVANSLTRLDPWFPGNLTTGILNEHHEAAILFEEFPTTNPALSSTSTTAPATSTNTAPSSAAPLAHPCAPPRTT